MPSKGEKSKPKNTHADSPENTERFKRLHLAMVSLIRVEYKLKSMKSRMYFTNHWSTKFEPFLRFSKGEIFEIHFATWYNFKAHTIPMSKASNCKSDKLETNVRWINEYYSSWRGAQEQVKSASRETNFNPWHSMPICLAFS